MLKSTSGLIKEKKLSKTFHLTGLPVLVSAHLLRKRNLGQIDLARLVKSSDEWRLEVIEVKNSSIDERFMQKRQFSRLKESSHFLGCIFEAEVSLAFE